MSHKPQTPSARLSTFRLALSVGARYTNRQLNQRSSTCPTQNILALNPRVHKTASLVPTEETKKARKYWKRNEDHKCGGDCKELLNNFEDVKHTTLSERGALKEAARYLNQSLFACLLQKVFLALALLVASATCCLLPPAMSCPSVPFS